MSEILENVLRVKVENPTTGEMEWKQIPAIRGTSVHIAAETTSSSGRGCAIITVIDESKKISDPSYTGDVVTIWNGLDGSGSVNTVDGKSADASHNISLSAVCYVEQSSLRANTSAQAIARKNIDAFQDISNPTNGQIPRYSSASSKWLPKDLTPAEVGAIHSALKINGKSINNPTTNSASITLEVGDVGGAVPTTTTINGYALNSNITLNPNDIGAVNAALKINDVLITNPTTSSASLTLTATNIGAVPTSRTVNGRALSANIVTRIVAPNITVSSWNAVDTSSSIYSAGFPYYATISISGVTTDMVPEVIFDINDSMSGIFAPIAETISGGVKIYASEAPENTITIPTIICFY